VRRTFSALFVSCPGQNDHSVRDNLLKSTVSVILYPFSELTRMNSPFRPGQLTQNAEATTVTELP
jgi:hypothetical protein